MKTAKSIVAIALLVVMMMAASCGGGGNAAINTAISQMEKVIDRVEKNKGSMTEADWKALEKELEEPAAILEAALENNSVSTMEKLKITAISIRYMAVLSEAALKTVNDSLSIFNEQIKEQLNSDEMKDALKELEKGAKEMEKLLNETNPK
jgi:hypothetical protein